jgi:hypothetical protein
VVDFCLTAIQRGIADDANLIRSVKSAFFTISTLEKILNLYQCNNLENKRHISPHDSNITIADKAHTFMLHICLSLGRGVRFSDNGWYPSNSTAEQGSKVNNYVLSKLLKSLKIGQDSRQRELFFKIVADCPELVHK